MNRILLVEDEPHVRAVVARVLHRQGCEVEVVPGGPEALTRIDAAVAAGESFGALVTDVRMPDVGGVRVAQAFHLAFPDAPILFMSGFHEDGDVHVMLAAGLAHFLPKPFTATELTHAMRAICPRAAGAGAAAGTAGDRP